MPPIFILFKKALRVRRALKKLALTKVNAERERIGLPIIRPWYAELYHRCFECARQSCVDSMCPCCVYKRRPLTLRFSNSCLVRAFIDGTCENQILKAIVGFLSGLFLAFLFYLLMVFHMEVPVDKAQIVAAIIAALLSFGLALSMAVRCVILSLLPQIFSGQGRMVCYTYLFLLISSGPILNFTNNVQVMSDSSTCGQGLVYNGTRELVQVMLSPVYDILESIRSVVRGIMALAEEMRRAFEAVKKAFLEIATAIQTAIRWLRETLDQCNEKMGTPYRKCRAAFDDAIRRCRESLSILDFLCHIPAAFDILCEVAKVTQLLCLITDAIKKILIDQVKSGVTMVVQNIEEMFYVNITIIQEFNYSMEQSKSYDQVRASIMDDIRSRMQPLRMLTTYCDGVFGLAFIWLIITTMIYRRKFLKHDHFDNCYISFSVRRIEDRRQEMGKETILPLTRRQKKKYITTTSLRMAPAEKVKLAYNTMVLVTYLLYTGFFLFCDLGLWWLLNMIKHHFMVKIHSDIPHTVNMHVEGDGILADMYRELITTFDPVGRVKLTMDTTHCLPQASSPDWEKYKAIGSLFGVILFLVLTEAYGLRLRHVIAGCYYPEREKDRGVWLYNHILRTRGGLLKFLRRRIRYNANHGGSRHLEDEMTWTSYIAASCPCLVPCLRRLGYRRKHCLSCGVAGLPDDRFNFAHCENHGCDGVYCMSCFSDLNNMCTLCMNPIDYGDLSDFSEEVDSSEDEDIADRRNATKRVRRMEGGRRRKVRFSDSDSSTDSSSDSSSDHSYQYVGRSITSLFDSDCISSGSETDYDFASANDADLATDTESTSSDDVSSDEMTSSGNDVTTSTDVTTDVSEREPKSQTMDRG